MHRTERDYRPQNNSEKKTQTVKMLVEIADRNGVIGWRKLERVELPDSFDFGWTDTKYTRVIHALVKHLLYDNIARENLDAVRDFISY